MRAIMLLIALTALLLTARPAYSEDIHDAVRAGDIIAVAEILDADPLEINSLDETGRTPLALAAAAGQRDIVDLLLERGALVNVANDRGAATLHYAASRGDSQIVRVLIEQRAVVNARAIGCATPLCWASSAGRRDAAEVLVAHGANVNAECIDLWTPLYRAASSGDLELVRLLLDHGAQVNMQCIEGKSPLHNAVGSGSEDIVGLLIDSGAEVEARDVLGRSPLWMAVENGHTGIAALLLESGAEIYPNDFESGQTPLHQAALRGYGNLVDLLIGSGADPEMSDAEGRTPAGLAQTYGHIDLARALVPARRRGDPPTLRQERPSPLHYSLKEGEAAIWYLGGYGVAVKTRSHLIVLDYSEASALPDQPSLANGHISPAEVGDENIIAVVPGLRTGYPVRATMELNRYIPEMSYVLGYSTERGPGHIYVDPMTSVKVGEAEMASIAPNRYAHGQDFLMTVDGVTVYKGFSWDYWDDKSSLAYREGLRFLGEAAGSCDIAIVPYAGGSAESREAILSDLLEMSREIGPRAALFVGSTWQHARDFAAEAREKGLSETVLFARYPGDSFLYTGRGLEALR